MPTLPPQMQAVKQASYLPPSTPVPQPHPSNGPALAVLMGSNLQAGGNAENFAGVNAAANSLAQSFSRTNIAANQLAMALAHAGGSLTTQPGRFAARRQ